jgi:signal transduction histidine kinase
MVVSATKVTPAPRERNAILAEQVRIVYVEGQRLIYTGIVASLILVWVLWGQVASHLLLSWLSAFLTYALVRIAMTKVYRNQAIRPSDQRTWMTRVQCALAVGGSLWGIAGFLLYVPEQLEYQLFLSVMMFGAAVSSLVTLAVYLPAYLVYVTPIVAATAIRYGLEDDALHWCIAAGSVAILFIFINFGRYIQRSFVESLSLRMVLAERNRELAERNREVEHANQAKTRFLAAASHDLRQPLHALGLFVDALDHAVRDPKAHALIAKLRASTDALDDLLGALLDVSKLDAGAVRPQPRAFPLSLLLDNMHAEFHALAAEKDLELRVRATRAVVYSDPELLQRILRNLIANAIRYTDRGRVLVGCRRRHGALRIEVWDTGCGIVAEQVSEIFKEFVQLGNPHAGRHKGGLGLGLSIIDRIARLLDHRVSVVSRPERGSVFCVEVPLRARADEQEPTRSASLEAAQKLGDHLILVVDDDAGVRDGMAEALSSWGCHALTAESEDEAVAILSRESLQPDAIIVDYHLPEHATGIEAIRGLRALVGTAVPVIMITGDTSAERLTEIEASAYPLLHKPVKPAQLRPLLNHVLALRA